MEPNDPDNTSPADLSELSAEEIAEGLARARLLAQPADTDGLRDLMNRVDAHHASLIGTPDESLSYVVKTELNTLIATAISDYMSFDDDSVALVRGAVEYYVLDADFEDDSLEHGIADDLIVVRAVRRRLKL